MDLPVGDTTRDHEKEPKARKAGRSRSPHRYRNRRLARVYGALDLGTNNCRLLIARPERGGFRVIDAYSQIVRLGEGLLANHVLSDLAMDRAVEALSACAQKVKRRRVGVLRSVATQACRMAANCNGFVDRVRDETGIALDVISPAEEARLAVLGCHTLLDPDTEHALVFDIGGGSTELVWVEMQEDDIPEIRAWTSLGVGVVNMSERFGAERHSIAQFEEMVAAVRDALLDFERAHDINARSRGKLQLLGTSGTVTTLTSLQLGLKTYDRRQVDGAIVDTGELRALSRRLAEMDVEERADFGCIGRERADLVVAGCTILDAILDLWPVEKLRVADRGIREGVLRSLMRQDGLDA